MSAEDWGTLGHLTADEEQAMKTLRQEVISLELPQYSDDKCLLRFCRARKFVVKKSLQMITEDYKWRQQFSEHEFRLNDFPSLLQFSDAGIARVGGRDLEHRPIVYLKPSEFYPSQVESDEELVLFYVYYMDALLSIADKGGREDFTVICDLAGWSFKNFSLPLTKLMVNILQNYYPERLGRVFVVNTPFVFSAAWTMVKPLLDERTRIKIHILGKDFSKLRHCIDEDSLEQKYKGNHEPYPVRDEIIQPLYDLALKDEGTSSILYEEEEEEDTFSEVDSATVIKKRHSLPKRFFKMVRRLKGDKRYSSALEPAESPCSRDASKSSRTSSKFSFGKKNAYSSAVDALTDDDLEDRLLRISTAMRQLKNQLDKIQAAQFPPEIIYASIAIMFLLHMITLTASYSYVGI